MARRKQEPIFSRLKIVEAEPPEEQRVEDSLRETLIPVPAAAVEEEVRYQPKLVEAEGVVAASRKTDAFAPFESSFVLVAPGTFPMGSPEYETGRGVDEIMHEVTLTRAFYMQKTPITREQWTALIGDNPAAFSDGDENCPVESISWNECREFIRRLNEKTKSRYRLPTEAEWEYACRSGTAGPFYNGEITEQFCTQDPVLCEAAWYCANSGRKCRPVAEKKPNAWGLYDLHGNVCEWCLDWYGEYSPEPQTDPSGPNTGPGKVIRGGSWFSNARNCRSAARFHWPPNSKSDTIGFRLVREIT
jgi:formylglycine-generating enzyme required for sulfatase activity